MVQRQERHPEVKSHAHYRCESHRVYLRYHSPKLQEAHHKVQNDYQASVKTYQSRGLLESQPELVAVEHVADRVEGPHCCVMSKGV